MARAVVVGTLRLDREDGERPGPWPTTTAAGTATGVGLVGDRESRLARAFVDLADTLVADFDIADLMQRLVEDCVVLLDAAQAGLVLVDQRGCARVVATTSESTRLLELLQVHLDDGPGLDCLRGGLPVLVDDLTAAGDRWPTFGPAAVGQGFRSVHALPLRLREETIGALSLFRERTGSLDPPDVRAAQALADIATIGVLQQRTIARGAVLAEQLQTALHSRVAIEQAKGVLAATGELDMDTAYARLRDYCRRRNLRLAATAREVAAGDLPATEVLAG